MIDFPLLEPVRTEDGWRVAIDVPEDTDYVRGHFPGAPILPAVAQLALLSQAASTCWKREVGIGGIVDLRFRGQIVPGDQLELFLSPADVAKELRFRLLNAGRVVSQGVVETRTDGTRA